MRAVKYHLTWNFFLVNPLNIWTKSHNQELSWTLCSILPWSTDYHVYWVLQYTSLCSKYSPLFPMWHLSCTVHQAHNFTAGSDRGHTMAAGLAPNTSVWESMSLQIWIHPCSGQTWKGLCYTDGQKEGRNEGTNKHTYLLPDSVTGQKKQQMLR